MFFGVAVRERLHAFAGAGQVPDVVYVVISRNLREERLEDDDGDVDPLTVDDTPEGVGSRTAHTEHVLRLWLGALLRSRAVKATLEAAKHELAEATEQLHTVRDRAHTQCIAPPPPLNCSCARIVHPAHLNSLCVALCRVGVALHLHRPAAHYARRPQRPSGCRSACTR